MSDMDRVSEAAAASGAIPPEFMQGGGQSLSDTVQSQASSIISSHTSKGTPDKAAISGQLDLLAQAVPDESLKVSLDTLVDAVSSADSIEYPADFVKEAFSASQSSMSNQSSYDGVNVSISVDATQIEPVSPAQDINPTQ